MNVLRTVLTIIYAIDCAVLVIVILMQQGKDQGLGAIAGMSSNRDTYWSRNKGRSKEGQMIRWTRVLAIIFIALSVVLNINF